MQWFSWRYPFVRASTFVNNLFLNTVRRLTTTTYYAFLMRLSDTASKNCNICDSLVTKCLISSDKKYSRDFFWDSKYYVSTHFWSAIFFSSCMIDHCPCNFFLHYLLLVLVVESWRTPYIKTVTIWLDVARLTLKRYPCELHSDPRYMYSN